MGKRPETQEKILEVLLSLEMRSTSEILSELNGKYGNSFTFSTIGKPLKSLVKKGYIIGNHENGRTVYSLCNDTATVKRLYNDPHYTGLRESFRLTPQLRNHLIQVAFPGGLSQEIRNDLDGMLQSSRMFFGLFLSLQEPRGDLSEYADLLDWYPTSNPITLEYIIDRGGDKKTDTPARFQMYLFLYASVRVIENEGFALCYSNENASPLGQSPSSSDTIRKYKQMFSKTTEYWTSFLTLHTLSKYREVKESKSPKDKEKKKQLESILDEIDLHVNRFIVALSGGNPGQSAVIKEDLIKTSEKLGGILYPEQK